MPLAGIATGSEAPRAICRAEKNLYELLYELDNRPAWVELPLRGLLSMLDDQSAAELP